MSKEVRYGFIGGGNIARAHAAAIQASGDRIVGIMDVNKEGAEKFANDYSVDLATTRLNTLINRDDIDAIIVCTPNSFHAKYTIASLQAGKHVLCEKPMATSISDCAKMIHAAKKAKKILTVGYVRRFLPDGELIKSKVDAGDLGKVYYAETKWLRKRGVPGYGGWFTTKKMSGGGPLIDLGCHMLDLTCWFLGHPKPKRVFASSGCHLAQKDYTYLSMWGEPNMKGTYDVEDYASAMIRFDNDTTLLLQVSWAINIVENNRLETWLAGDKGGCVNGDKGLHFVGQERGGLKDTSFELPEGDGFTPQIAHFSDCIRRGKAPRVKPEEAMTVQKILQAIYDSARLKREVVVR